MILAGGDWCILARVAGGPARQNYGYDGWLQRESHTAPRFQLRAPLLRTHSLLNPPSQFSLSLSLSLSRSLSLFQGAVVVYRPDPPGGGSSYFVLCIVCVRYDMRSMRCGWWWWRGPAGRQPGPAGRQPGPPSSMIPGPCRPVPYDS